MGYGSCALAQLQQYFEGKFPNLKESAADGNEDKEDDQEDDDGEAKQVDDEVKIMCFQMLLLLAFQAHFVTFLPILVKVIFLIWNFFQLEKDIICKEIVFFATLNLFLV